MKNIDFSLNATIGMRVSSDSVIFLDWGNRAYALLFMSGVLCHREACITWGLCLPCLPSSHDFLTVWLLYSSFVNKWRYIASLYLWQVYFNYEWLHTKLTAMSMQRLLADFNLCDDPEVNLVASALNDIRVVFDPDILGIELTGRWVWNTYILQAL